MSELESSDEVEFFKQSLSIVEPLPPNGLQLSVRFFKSKATSSRHPISSRPTHLTIPPTREMQSVFARSPVVSVGTPVRRTAGGRKAVGGSRTVVSKATAMNANTSDLRASAMTAASARFRLATAKPAAARVSHRYVAVNAIESFGS